MKQEKHNPEYEFVRIYNDGGIIHRYKNQMSKNNGIWRFCVAAYDCIYSDIPYWGY